MYMHGLVVCAYDVTVTHSIRRLIPEGAARDSTIVAAAASDSM